MTKATIEILAMVFPVLMMAQLGSMEKLFKKYEKCQGFELEVSDTNIDLDIYDGSGFMNFIDEAESFYVLNFEYGSGDERDLEIFKTKLDKLIEKNNYSTMLDLSGEEDFRLLVLKDGETIDSMLMMTSDEDDAAFILVTK